MDAGSEYLGITEAAEYLRVSASTLRRWEKKGFLVPERTPTGIRRYTRRQLDDVLNAPDRGVNSHVLSPTMGEGLAGQSTEVYEVANEYLRHDDALGNVVGDGSASDGYEGVFDHQYGKSAVFGGSGLEVVSEPERVDLDSADGHVEIRSQLDQLVETSVIDQPGLSESEVITESYAREGVTEGGFWESVHHQNIDEPPSAPSLDNYLARPLAIDTPPARFDNESFYQNRWQSNLGELATNTNSPVYEQPKGSSALKNLGMFVGIFTGFLIFAMLVWFVYSIFLSGQQQELLRPVVGIFLRVNLV